LRDIVGADVPQTRGHLLYAREVGMCRKCFEEFDALASTTNYASILAETRYYLASCAFLDGDIEPALRQCKPCPNP
jgi:hypothetical protein